MPPVSMKKADILVSLLLVPVCLYVFYESGRWPKEALIGAPTLIPRGVSACLLLAGGLLLVQALRGRAKELETPLVGANRRRVLLNGLLTGAYAAIVAYVGFLISTFAYLLLFGLIGRKPPAPFAPLRGLCAHRHLFGLFHVLQRAFAGGLASIACG